MLFSMNSVAEISKVPAGMPLPDRELLITAISHSTRWKMLKELTCGEARTIDEMAKAGGCSYDNASKHLARLVRRSHRARTRAALPDGEAISADARRTARGFRPLPAAAGCGGINYDRIDAGAIAGKGAQKIAIEFLRISRGIMRQQKLPLGQNQIAKTLHATKAISTNVTDVRDGGLQDALRLIRLNV